MSTNKNTNNTKKIATTRLDKKRNGTIELMELGDKINKTTQFLQEKQQIILDETSSHIQKRKASQDLEKGYAALSSIEPYIKKVAIDVAPHGCLHHVYQTKKREKERIAALEREEVVARYATEFFGQAQRTPT